MPPFCPYPYSSASKNRASATFFSSLARTAHGRIPIVKSLRFYLLALPVLAVLLLPTCQQQQQQIQPYRGYKMAPYTLRGVRYEPMSVAQALRYSSTCIASYYEADGHIGAIGQKLYEGQLYAAHKTLPLPCTIRITNVTNGKSCIARVADRGPFIHGRELDVSSEVARRLGFYRKGLERVHIKVLSVGDGKWKRTR